jgi:hypothetical protein
MRQEQQTEFMQLLLLWGTEKLRDTENTSVSFFGINKSIMQQFLKVVLWSLKKNKNNLLTVFIRKINTTHYCDPATGLK